MWQQQQVPQVPKIAVQKHQEVQQQSTDYSQKRAALANAQTEQCRRRNGVTQPQRPSAS